jgi:hypothetical protein
MSDLLDRFWLALIGQQLLPGKRLRRFVHVIYRMLLRGELSGHQGVTATWNNCSGRPCYTEIWCTCGRKF